MSVAFRGFGGHCRVPAQGFREKGPCSLWGPKQRPLITPEKPHLGVWVWGSMNSRNRKTLNTEKYPRSLTSR